MTTHSSIPSWEIPWTEEPAGLHSIARVRNSLVSKPPPHAGDLQCCGASPLIHSNYGASQVVPMVKTPPANVGNIRDAGSIPGSGRSPGGGNAARSSECVWRILWTEKPGMLQSTGSKSVEHDFSDSARTHTVSIDALPEWRPSTSAGGCSLLPTLSSLGSL